MCLIIETTFESNQQAAIYALEQGVRLQCSICSMAAGMLLHLYSDAKNECLGRDHSYWLFQSLQQQLRAVIFRLDLPPFLAPRASCILRV